MNVREPGLRLPTVPLELCNGTVTEKPPRSPWLSWYTNDELSRAVITVNVVVLPTFVGKDCGTVLTTPLGPTTTKPDGVSVTVLEPLV